MGLLSIIVLLMAGVGFLTFGFTVAVCGTPPNRYHAGQIENSSVIIHGLDYDFSNFKHPAVGIFNGQTNPLIQGNWSLAANDASFLFQKTNQNCLGLIKKANSSSITGTGDNLDWYLPCNVHNQSGATGVNLTGYESGTNCHSSSRAKSLFSSLHSLGQVYYTWDDVRSTSRNLAVYES
jgi:chitin synthase